MDRSADAVDELLRNAKQRMERIDLLGSKGVTLLMTNAIFIQQDYNVCKSIRNKLINTAGP